MEPERNGDILIRASYATDYSIAQDYTDNGCRFGARLARAVPNLFTFLRHPHMEPTNNSAERMLRSVVISRKIRYGTRNEGGMRRFGTLMTCFLTWERRGASVSEMLLRILVAT